MIGVIGASQSQVDDKKRKRASEACDACRRKRKRCEPPERDGEGCPRCRKEGSTCSFTEPTSASATPYRTHDHAPTPRPVPAPAVYHTPTSYSHHPTGNGPEGLPSVNDTARLVGSSATRASKACDTCKAKKKRCDQGPIPGGACARCGQEGITCSFTRNEYLVFPPHYGHHSPMPHPGPQPPPHSMTVHAHGHQHHLPPPPGPHPSQLATRFIGDLNPESQLLQLDKTRSNGPSMPASRRNSFGHGRSVGGNNGDVGVWVTGRSGSGRGKPAQADTKNEDTKNGGDGKDEHIQNEAELMRAALENLRQKVSFLSEVILPSKDSLDALLDIYFRSVNLFLPIVDETTFRRAYTEDPTTVSKPLILAMTLVASKHDDAIPYLTDRPRNFGARVYEQLTALLAAGYERDKVTLIKILALASLHAEGSEGGVEASMMIAKCVHHVQTLGLHLPRVTAGHGHGHGPGDESVQRLFWAVWTLDRFHAVLSGRPILLHAADMGIADPPRLPGAFGVWLRITGLLDRVIAFYRPRLDGRISGGWEEGFPSFEDVIGEEEVGVGNEMVTLLEVYYHAVSMLTHRSRLVVASGATPSSTRQSLSAYRILQMDMTGLAPLPIIPYTATLAMTVFYRQFRMAKLTTLRARARADWERAQKVLEGLGDRWWSAEAMGNLGRSAMEKVEKRDHPPPPPVQTRPVSAEANLHLLVHAAAGGADADLPQFETQANGHGMGDGGQGMGGSPWSVSSGLENLDTFLLDTFPDPCFPTEFLDPAT
ncbi:hypothetical protein SAICODRAFT_20502 [Saitoella complicata NRRL Y-17804]|uniref:Zn(2)-C6 fungal-type domain-containing protein n=1 Tax=Saitoella complicata (strain BCRC 22490 / CBS 7301 / JCM 7358 / NBRC 10748 / NRRL Y-17804) TaxID=698492 RepID=A0A0E9NBP2_SAICN|nr:uncharacterized protein SAICODRAFT_20502 [Saitoella complicata NRRL Y-17804]ODQ51477.1 hypothetical protein SAICODRAFT_20502 [Saitoella complicata NRRL Y-17804]GAO47223.1 hypothetical protein G7K_1433-t1 [Saitoella complicata NRRL Y-17804]